MVQYRIKHNRQVSVWQPWHKGFSYDRLFVEQVVALIVPAVGRSFKTS